VGAYEGGCGGGGKKPKLCTAPGGVSDTAKTEKVPPGHPGGKESKTGSLSREILEDLLID
jgi:hypothetical protein